MPPGLSLASQIALWVVVLANLLITLALVRRMNTRRPPVRPGLSVGVAAPPLLGETLEGKPVSGEAFGARTAFVFVAPNCQPCVESLPEYLRLAGLSELSPPRLVVVSSGDAEATRRMPGASDASSKIVLAPKSAYDAFDQYKASSTPHFTLVEDGRVAVVGAPYMSDSGWATLVSSWERTARTPSMKKIPVGIDEGN